MGYNDPPNAQGRPLLDGEEADERNAKESKSPEVEQPGGSSNAGGEQSRPPKRQHEPAPPSREGQSQTDARAATSVGLESPESGASTFLCLSIKTKQTFLTDMVDPFEMTARSALISSHRTHAPYFRYFGPTAIVPGFKQMVCLVRRDAA